MAAEQNCRKINRAGIHFVLRAVVSRFECGAVNVRSTFTHCFMLCRITPGRLSMDPLVLQQLDLQTVDQALALWTQIQQAQRETFHKPSHVRLEACCF